MTTHLPAAFDGVETWVFDLDNTLYPAACNLFAQIDERMTLYIEERLSLPRDEARRIQKGLYVEHGTTLAGLMIEHDVDPHHFMDYVHDIDVSGVAPDETLKTALAELPGRRLVHTNGSVGHAENVLAAIGLTDLIEDIFDVEMGGWVPKPQRSNYDLFGQRFGIEPTSAAMFEDMAVNLEVPHAIGMRTVLITSDAPWIADEPEEKRPGASLGDAPHIHHTTDDLGAFLKALAPAPAPRKKTA